MCRYSPNPNCRGVGGCGGGIVMGGEGAFFKYLREGVKYAVFFIRGLLFFVNIFLYLFYTKIYLQKVPIWGQNIPKIGVAGGGASIRNGIVKGGGIWSKKAANICEI